MTEPEFDTDEERQAYAAGLEAAATKPLTLDDVRNMPVSEVMRRKGEVHEVLKRHADGGEAAGNDDTA